MQLYCRQLVLMCSLFVACSLRESSVLLCSVVPDPLSVQVPRLRATTLRELQPLFSEMSKDQCIACTPVMVLGLPDTALVASAPQRLGRRPASGAPVSAVPDV